MKKFNNVDYAKLQELHSKAIAYGEDIREKLEELESEFQSKLTEELDPLIELYNNSLYELEDIVDTATGDMDMYFDDRSEKWQEGQAGEDYYEWKSEWENVAAEALNWTIELDSLTVTIERYNDPMEDGEMDLPEQAPAGG